MAPTPLVVKKLAMLSGNSCAMDNCEVVLAKPEWKNVFGEIAHIRAQKAGGERWDPDYPDPDDYDNLMILCPNCHTIIDHTEPDEWPVGRPPPRKARRPE